ncbi:MAG: 5-formyltetrahydrofolate cyclo-ligase, partial [Hyphomicrobiaceae bacterium]
TVLPTVLDDRPDLVFRRWKPGDPLATGAFGVEEPLPESPAIDPSTLIIPLLAFDRAGYRLGYGGGYYDRTIERLGKAGRITTIGVAYDEQEVIHVPREAHDQKLDAIATPSRVITPEI